MNERRYEFAQAGKTAENGKVEFELEALGFPGFYESILWDADTVCASIWDEYAGEFVRPLTDDEVEEIYSSINREAYERDVDDVYMSGYIDLMNCVSDGLITKLSTEGVRQHSPAHYNFSTDRIFQKVLLDLNELKAIHEKCIESKDFRQFLKDSFTARDGWMPYLSEDIEDWKSLETLDGAELNVLLHYHVNSELKRTNDVDINESCEWTVFEEDKTPVNYVDMDVLNQLKERINLVLDVPEEKPDNSLDNKKKRGIRL